MRALIRLALLALLVPTSAGSADYQFTRLPDKIVVNKGGEVEYLPQRQIVTRLYRFIVKYTDCRQPMLLAELLANTDYPRELAGIYFAEANYNGELVGPCGEVGPFQFMPDEGLPPNYDPLDLAQNVSWAEMKLKEKIAENGSVREGVRAYNGSSWNPLARAYRDKVLKYAGRV